MEEGDVWKAIQKQPDLDHAPSDLVQVCLVISTCSLLNIINIIVAFCSSSCRLSLELMVNLPTMQQNMWSRD